MLAKLVNRIFIDIFNRLSGDQVLAPALVSQIVSRPPLFGQLDLKEIFDGFLWGTPKRRTPRKKLWSRRYGNDNWGSGTKLWKPKRNIISCLECGSFHEFHTICRSCFDKVSAESQKIIEELRKAWDMQPIDKEVEILYQGEKPGSVESKRIVEMDRPRPLWFSPNLAQRTANLSRKINAPPMTTFDRNIRIKDS